MKSYLIVTFSREKVTRQKTRNHYIGYKNICKAILLHVADIGPTFGNGPHVIGNGPHLKCNRPCVPGNGPPVIGNGPPVIGNGPPVICT